MSSQSHSQSQSQGGRPQPYALSTPRGNPAVRNTANRASLRSIRGLGGNSPMGGPEEGPKGDTPNANLSNEEILAAIARLSTKFDQEFLVMSDQVHQEINTMTDKIDEDIATLSNKFDEDIAAVSAKAGEQFSTLSNKIDRVTDGVDELASTATPGGAHQAGNPQANTAVVATPAKPWSYTYELKQRVYAFAYESVHLPNISGYTAVEDPNGDLLVNSLFNTIKQRVKDIPGTWAAEQLPPVVNGLQDVAATQKYTTLVKDAGKHAREKLHLLVLHNIKNNPTGTVPNLKRLLHRIARHCGKTAEGLDDVAYWAQTPTATRLRIAYLRREAIRIFQSLRAGGGGGNIWHRVDLQLHRLAEEGTLYSSAFYKLIYDQDRALFDGKGFFVDIDLNEPFDLPSEQEIEEEMAFIEAAGSIVLQD
ncbi:uncharacterized protein MELLADRAFT_85415 [Melampsora larici-populina 98AG31]|uniref:Uncharacterized protein n=1 Tax=Melampsora larici-populina (strain 98AG31 / pathotype 3-4-7) TaxID=747676 RepID=F4RIL4_MELLP|nr:uncharacterized protein MELLADRAFT_85415 [Melampsora larici-populina 98AG31]EGG07813.1 hypothetical protein MELLADRAFT_85415 [Melampsora larici-populina 98AG31]